MRLDQPYTMFSINMNQCQIMRELSPAATAFWPTVLCPVSNHADQGKGVRYLLQERMHVPQRRATLGSNIQCHSLRCVSIPQPVLEQFKLNLELCVSLIAAFT